MILVVNLVINDIPKAYFDSAMKRRLSGTNYETLYKEKFYNSHLPDISKYSHLIISGSEASVPDHNPWDENLKKLVFSFMKESKPVLGICYGHQFLASLFLSKAHVTKTKTPEFGVANIDIKKNPLFKGIESLASCVLHFDEVVNENSDFTLIASGPRCQNYAFQYMNYPLWGVQFHPEFNQTEIDCYVNYIKEQRKHAAPYIIYDEFSPEHLDNTQIIFDNFVNL